MALKQRITELMEQLSVGIPEREYCIQLAFLTMIIGEPFYIYGRSGSGKGIILDRLIAAFKDAKALKVGRRQQEVPSKLNAYDIIVFKSYDPSNENIRNWVQIALQDRDRIPLIVSGDIRPEVALTRGDISNAVKPDNVSANGAIFAELLNGSWCVQIASITPSFTPWRSNSLSFSERSGGRTCASELKPSIN